jgi:hypothetical protein
VTRCLVATLLLSALALSGCGSETSTANVKQPTRTAVNVRSASASRSCRANTGSVFNLRATGLDCPSAWGYASAAATGASYPEPADTQGFACTDGGATPGSAGHAVTISCSSGAKAFSFEWGDYGPGETPASG